MYNSDANGDGNIQNDLFYVPRDQGDIALTVPTGSTAQAEWDKLNNYIVSEPCLREQRGKDHGARLLPESVAEVPGPPARQSDPDAERAVAGDHRGRVQLLNLVNKDWGINRETNFFEQVTGWLTMSATQYDTRGTPLRPTIAGCTRSRPPCRR